MDKMEFQEKVWGGIFGIVAIIAAIAEAIVSGVSVASVLGAIKDVSGTLIVAVLLITFIKQLPRRPKNLLEKLENEVEEWGKRNAPLIFKAEGYKAVQGSEYVQGFVLLQNPEEYISLLNIKPESSAWKDCARYGNGKGTGKFISMPSYETMVNSDFNIEIYMKQSHFINKEKFEETFAMIVESVNVRYANEVEAKRNGKSFEFTVHVKKGINTDDDMQKFVEIMDYILSLVKVVM